MPSSLPAALRATKIRVLLAALCGLAMGLSWQPYNWWWCALLAPGAMTLLVAGTRRRAALGIGYVFALAMAVVTISWIRVLGLPVAIGLIGFMSLFYAVQAVAISIVSTLRWSPLWASLCWVGTEFVFTRFPFGGFGWTRVAFTAVDSPLSGWYPWVGMAGTTFVIVLISHGLWWLAARWHWVRTGRTVALLPVLAALVATTAWGAVSTRLDPVIGATEAGSVTVGVVQGNVPGLGIEAMGRARSVTNNHYAETIALATRARLGLIPQPDFILWPESSTDIDPSDDPLTAETIQAAAETAGVPILVGAVTRGPGANERQTTAIWWDPVTGPGAVYHKQNLVPFGEWIPFRDQLLPLVPMLELVGDQGVPGTQPGAMAVKLVDGRPIVVGNVICFELAYDRTIRSMLLSGSQVVVVQSNNATYGGTEQIEQQFAITRARAMESRREIAVATTNSVSGAIDRHGGVQTRTEEFSAASFTATLPIRTGLTPAIMVGGAVDTALSVLALVGIGYGLVSPLIRRRRARDTSVTPNIGDNG